MAEEKETLPQNLEHRLSNIEHWVEENKKLLTYIVGGMFAIVALYFGITKYYLEPRNIEANNQIFMAQKWFADDSLNLALNGDGNFPGFISIVDDYKWTDAANLSHYYLGVIYLKQGKFEDAIDELKSFSGKDKLVTNMALGAMGDAYSELGKNDDAVDYYKKAAYHFENELTTPVFLKKAGMLLEAEKKNDEAKKLYEDIKAKFPNSTEGRDIDKYIARTESLAKS
jgi:tetratricopeptide (TPR) repeat protein